MKSTITRHFILFNDAISKDHQEDIQEFISIFGDKFKINWKRDNTITVRNRHNKKGGANLLVEFKSRHMAEVNPNQLKLFEEIEEPEDEENENGSVKEKKNNVKELTS